MGWKDGIKNFVTLAGSFAVTNLTTYIVLYY